LDTTLTTAVAGTPLRLLRIEGLALFALATVGFTFTGQSWWLYAALFLAPDVSFAAYTAGPRIGAWAYNALHSTIGPAILAGIGLLLNSSIFLGIAAIWAAHIGFDRMLGYGLKYASAFNDTHLGRIGRARAGA
jgi:hypothetical protein